MRFVLDLWSKSPPIPSDDSLSRGVIDPLLMILPNRC